MPRNEELPHPNDAKNSHHVQPLSANSCVEYRTYGGLGEWFKPAVLKTAEGVILP